MTKGGGAMNRAKIPALVSFLIIFAPFVLRAGQTANPARASEKRILKAGPLPLDRVRLNAGPLKNAQDLNARYLLQLEPDRMLSLLRRRAGLDPGKEPYNGWDGDGRQLTGHIAGHYLSAVSYMWAATGDPRFKERADYVVRELRVIQEAHRDGYIGGLMDREGVDGKVRFQDLARGIIRSESFDLNGLWSPWYVQHKIFAGLRDAYRHAGNREALGMEVRFAAWAESILSSLDETQVQRMLNTEFGGMNEVAADLYADTGDPRWLALAGKFRHRAIEDPLAAGKDILAGKHGNTQVPKLLGTLKRYIYTGEPHDLAAARFFWNQVALHHSFATGGHGKNEYFGPPDMLNNMVDGRTAETCNVYNMIKLTRELFSVEPDARYADFHERALFNHILASIDPEDGRTCYMVPVGRGVQHEYQDMLKDFTCCVGTGMESQALHGHGIYYGSRDTLWINLYVPSTAEWEEAGVKLEMITGFPEGETAALRITVPSPRTFDLALRQPAWARDGFSVRVNGKAAGKLSRDRRYVHLNRTWKNGDTVDVVLPRPIRVEALPDNPSRVAWMLGPLVLAGDLGPAGPHAETGLPDTRPQPAFVTRERSFQNLLIPVPGRPGVFRPVDLDGEKDEEFVPFYRLPRRKYAIYWDVFTPLERQAQVKAAAAAEEERKQLESATVAFVQPGMKESEDEYNLRGENASPVRAHGRFGRRGSGWFSYDIPVHSGRPMILIVTYSNDERQKRTFNVVVDGTILGQEEIERRSPEQEVRFFDVQYELPAGLVKGKQKVTVRIESAGGREIAAVFGLRMIRR
jgi:hypothetical protein